eukprot:TRINITY_DN16978_c0_g1_i1.p1 TRINITY_DN16978_c0_g1~~TRINITY_DN16978_c0_g1_i1.p1  ORF type:complete len:618 (+),score=201.54 TRINITY_DN16978_c0_g1_i1:50-1855(+)
MSVQRGGHPVAPVADRLEAPPIVVETPPDRPPVGRLHLSPVSPGSGEPPYDGASLEQTPFLAPQPASNLSGLPLSARRNMSMRSGASHATRGSRLTRPRSGMRFMFGCLDNVYAQLNIDHGSPLWTYYEFKRMVTEFWVVVCIVQTVPMVYAGAAGLWHEHPEGSYRSLFVDAWSGDSSRLTSLRYVWWAVNGITLALAVLLVAYIRTLADWRTSHPSLRHLLAAGAMLVKLRKPPEEGPDRLESLHKVLNTQSSGLTVNLKFHVTDDADKTDRIYRVDINPESLTELNKLKKQTAEHVEAIEVLTQESVQYLERVDQEVSELAETRGMRHHASRRMGVVYPLLRLRLVQVLNVVVFVGLTVGAAFLVRWLTDTRESKSGDSTVEYVLVSAVLTVTKVVFEKISGVLGAVAFSNLVEMKEAVAFLQRLAFKVVLLLVVVYWMAPDEKKCREGVLAATYFVYMLIDYVVGWLVQFVVPVLFNALKVVRGIDTKRESMELHEEYLDVAYNQFVLYLAVPVFPGAAYFGLLFNIVEGWLDHWKIRSRFVEMPEGSAAENQISIVATALSILGLVAAAVPDIGVLSVLNKNAGSTSEDWGPCTFP